MANNSHITITDPGKLPNLPTPPEGVNTIYYEGPDIPLILAAMEKLAKHKHKSQATTLGVWGAAAAVLTGPPGWIIAGTAAVLGAAWWKNSKADDELSTTLYTAKLGYGFYKNFKVSSATPTQIVFVKRGALDPIKFL